MKLGSGMYIVHGVEDLKKSSPFYEKLGFKKVQESDSYTSTNNFILFTDERLNLKLIEGKTSTTRLLYFNKEIEKDLTKFEKIGVRFHTIKKVNQGQSKPFTAEFVDPNGLEVIIVNEQFNQKHLLNPKDNVSFVDWGKFGEYSLLVKDFDKAEKYLNALGFETLFKEKNPYPFGILYDEMLILGLHQTDDYVTITGQSLTYFHPQMDKKIKELQNKGFEFTKFSEGSIEAGQAVLQSPDGLTFFLFKGSI